MTVPQCAYCVVIYEENRTLGKAIVSQDQEIAALHRRLQWRTLLVAVAFAAGFALCAALTAVGLEALR